MKKEYQLFSHKFKSCIFVNGPNISHVYFFYEHRAKIKSVLPFFFNSGGK